MTSLTIHQTYQASSVNNNDEIVLVDAKIFIRDNQKLFKEKEPRSYKNRHENLNYPAQIIDELLLEYQ